MPALPSSVSTAWEKRKGPIILTTVDNNGVPNAIYVTCVSKFSEDTIVVADNYFNKTRRNILAGSRRPILFMTKNGESYQIKGSIEYHKEGEFFDDMKRWNPKHRPGNAAAVLKVEEVYAGAEKLL
jgi:predicted pyridoxine 5'-phosphate oxidase superfamily flavin-nucleotide-binding protein